MGVGPQGRPADRGGAVAVDADARAELYALLAEIAAGRHAALAELYRRTSAKLFGLCLRILGDRGEAEDVLQETYVSVWRRAGDYDPSVAAPMTWLIVIARNRAIDRLRASRVLRASSPVEDVPEIADPAESPFEAVAASDDASRLRECLGTLDGESAAAVRRAFFDGRTYEEVATEQGLPLGTLKSRIRRGLQKLRACLGDE